MTTLNDRDALLENLGLDAQNKAALGKLLNTGNIAQASEARTGG